MVNPPPTSPPGPSRGGQRRNFDDEANRTPHKFPIGTRVMFQSPNVRIPIGPLFVVEYLKPMLPQGPPQYILQHTFGPTEDKSKYVISDETKMVECKENDPPGDIENTEALMMWHWLSEQKMFD